MPHTISCLDFASSFFGYESARATGTKLKDNPPLSLDIRSCLYATSNVVQDLLSSCYNLNRLRADCIDAGDMGTGPWLHVLRLGKHASGHSAEDGPNAYIDFTLAQGLGNLASLEELRDLDLTRMHPRMGVEEAIWIQGHWPRLRRLSGIFHPDETIAVQMVEYLRKGRPDVVIVA
ncbi:hypothetical protein BG004_005832 [Podila humilis]|nr:hypothetical protein BG004_005832 [Podila humilis]